MQELVLFIAQSLDGYIARSDASIDWLLHFDDESTTNRYTMFLNTIDTIVMGYSTYRQVIEELSVDNWPYKNVKVIVLTHRKLENPYGVTFYQGDINALINELKKQTKKNIWLVGGSKIIDQCIQRDLIDRYIITLIPIILGDGIPLFINSNKSLKLKQMGITILNKCVECEYIRDN